MRDRYYQMRKQRQFDFQLLYDYYIEQGGKAMHPNNFIMVANQVRKQDILNQLDSHFNITVLQDPNGKEIRVV